MHEVPFDPPEMLANLQKLSDEQIIAACQGIFAHRFIEQDVNDGAKKWEALGSEYHTRLLKNYVTWVRGYVNALEPAAREVVSVPANLQQRPIFWTVGSLNQGIESGEGFWKSNFEVSKAAGLKIDIERLRCLHLPNITIPEQLVGWIEECVGKVKD